MIQRIQSIYLLLAAILMAVTAFSPLMIVGTNVVTSLGILEGEEIIKPTWGIVSMAGLTTVISTISIFLFKNRKRQITLVNICIGLGLFFYATVLIYMLSYYSNFPQMFTSIAHGIVLPLCALIFLFLAKGRIQKDEKLVRSLDRIR